MPSDKRSEIVVNNNTVFLNSSSSKVAKSDLEPKTFLKPLYFVLPDGKVFVDKKIPENIGNFPAFSENSDFSPKYFTDLHKLISSFDNYNHLGARVPLPHS